MSVLMRAYLLFIIKGLLKKTIPYFFSNLQLNLSLNFSNFKLLKFTNLDQLV